jgi:two-component system KDP operon response regulator KdpE
VSVPGLRVLVIDDEQQIHRFLTHALAAAGYTAIRADTGTAGLKEIATRAPDAVILDLGLPDMDGKNVLQKARQFYQGPILILSARGRETEKIEALDLGADDFVEKPFGVGELLARLRAALRRGSSTQEVPKVIQCSDLTIDFEARSVQRDGEPVRLSRKESELLLKLVQGSGRVLTHRQLLTAVWGPGNDEDTQYLRVFIGRLRQKLEADPSVPRHIITETGVGYRFIAT